MVLMLLIKACALSGVPAPIDIGEFESPAPPLQFRQIQLQPILTDLAFPIAATHAGDGSGRLFIALQSGVVLVRNPAQSSLQVFLDIRSQVNCCGESGLLGLAFDPRFADNGAFYVNYINHHEETIVARYVADELHQHALTDSALVVLRIHQPTQIHNGGHLAFGPDGYLYIGTGDGGSFAAGGDGSGGDPHNHAQRTDSLLGKLLRIDVSAATPDRPYAIPPDNPLVDTPNARAEIWALGLKNPWRFSFDRETGELYITDVGHDRWEEINIQPAHSPDGQNQGGKNQGVKNQGGKNYGWHIMEGPDCFASVSNCDKTGLQAPVVAYSHNEGCAIIGGHVYRGAAYPQARGRYVFGDFCSGTLWELSRAGGIWLRNRLADTGLNISAFGEDEQGEIYVIGRDSEQGAVYRILFEEGV